MPTITQPGVHTARISVDSDTPYAIAPVQVSMRVQPPATWGKIAGTVTTVDGTRHVVPVVGATVSIDGAVSPYTLATTAGGGYGRWLDTKNNPVEVTVAKDGYRPQTASLTVLAGKLVTRNWRLVLN